MGCLCPPAALPQIVNASQIQSYEKNDRNVALSNKYRQQGRAFFNSRKYSDAEAAYKFALMHDSDNFLNFTNLALSLKSLHRLSESIRVIQSMEQRANYIITQGNKAYLVKGKIIKARCQMILAKNLITSLSKSEKDNRKTAKNLSEASLITLKALSKDQQLISFCKQLGIDRYLSNAQKINTIVTKVDAQMGTYYNLFAYISQKIVTQEAHQLFKNSNMNIYFEGSNDILNQLNRWQRQWIKKRFNQKEQQQFTIDPISYEQFYSPIIVQSGLTYEEQTLKSHYSKNGTYDPITRQPLKKQLGILNKTLQAYIFTSKKTSNLKQLDLLDL